MTDLHGKVRARDPETSWSAAAQQTESKADAVKAIIMHVLTADGASTDEHIVDRYEALRWVNPGRVPAATPQSIRTRRHALVLEGRVIDTGRRARTRTGSTATVWAAAA